MHIDLDVGEVCAQRPMELMNEITEPQCSSLEDHVGLTDRRSQSQLTVTSGILSAGVNTRLSNSRSHRPYPILSEVGRRWQSLISQNI